MIKVDIDDAKMTARFKSLTQQLGDLTPVWQDLKKIFIQIIRANFRTEGQHSGPGWAPLNPAYARYKARKYPGKTILRATDTLFKSLTGVGGGWIERITPRYAEFGTRVAYAKFHQLGTSRMPARPPIPNLTREDGAAMADAILAFILKKMNNG